MADLLTQQQLADELQVSVRTLERWRREGTGPPWVRVGRSPRYRRSDVERWLEATRRDSAVKVAGHGEGRGARPGL